VIYEEFPPAEDLRGIVACFWRFVPEQPVLHVIPPDGTVSITWLPLQRFAVVLGPRMDALRVEVSGGCEYRGLRLRPGVAESVLRVSAPSLRGQNIPLQICSPHLPPLEDPSALQDWVRKWPAPQSQDERPLLWISKLLEDPETKISSLAAESGLGYRQMLRLFYAAAGLTPKEFARLRKIRQACIRSIAGDAAGWADISAEAGFADQAHLTREFSQVFGWSPRLMQEYLRRIEHRFLR
jgi:AraC-like DNA-binding protein